MKVLVLLFAVAVLVAADAVKEKRDVLLRTGSPYYAPAVPYTYHHHAIVDPARTLAYAPTPGIGYASHAAAPAVAYTAHAAAPAVAYNAPAASVAYSTPAATYPAYDDGQYFPGKYERPTFPVV